MKTILDLQPAIVWEYFHEITQVPRPSKKEGKIIRYLENFAAQHNLPIKMDCPLQEEDPLEESNISKG